VDNPSTGYPSNGAIYQEDIAVGHRFQIARLRQFPQASPSEYFFLFGSFSFFVEIGTLTEPSFSQSQPMPHPVA
jgi:hypothetical protein